MLHVYLRACEVIAYLRDAAGGWQPRGAAHGKEATAAGAHLPTEDLREEHSVEEMAAMETVAETEFRSMIGSLAFASVTIRWDIAYSVSVLSRYLMKPNREVIAAARRVIQYLITMLDFKIRCTSEEDKVPADKRNKLWGVTDASYASDVITRRSHGGYIFFLNGGCVSWKSGLQKMVTLNSCESEFVAFGDSGS